MDGPRALAAKLDEIAASVSASSIEAEMGAMCQRSFFGVLHSGEALGQGDVDEATQAFSKLTDRLMPVASVHAFVRQTIQNKLMPESVYADLVPGFTSDEALAGKGAAERRASPAKKFTEGEVLACLAWNQKDPAVLVAISHLVQLTEGYVEGLRHVVARRSVPAAEKLGPFAAQWAPKNVLKFLNVALFVEGRRRGDGEAIRVDAELIEQAMDLLNASGAFTWEVSEDPSVTVGSVERIHCPAHGFLHRFLAKEGALLTVLDFVRAEAAKKPVHASIKKSLEVMERTAISEETGIRTFGQEWSRMKLE